MMFVALFLALIGFALIGVADPHSGWHRRLGTGRRRSIRRSAWFMLVLSLAATIIALGWRIASVEWVGIVMLAAGMVFCSLNLLLPQSGRKR